MKLLSEREENCVDQINGDDVKTNSNKCFLVNLLMKIKSQEK